MHFFLKGGEILENGHINSDFTSFDIYLFYVDAVLSLLAEDVKRLEKYYADKYFSFILNPDDF